MKGFQSRLPAARWEEGLLCGNGTIGAMVMGWPKEETIYFTHEKLYAPFAPKREPVHTAGHLEAIRRMMLDGRYEEAAEFVVNLSYQEGYGPRIEQWTDGFTVACDMKLRFPQKEEPEDYKKSLNFENGQAQVSFTLGSSRVTRDFFVSRAAGIAVMRITSSEPVSFEVSLEKHQEIQEACEPYWKEVGYDRRILDPLVAVQDHTLLYEGVYQDTDFGYRCAVKVAETDGAVCGEPDRITVRNARDTLLFYNILPVPDRRKAVPRAEDSFESLPLSYEELLQAHARLHNAVYSRMELKLSDPQAPKSELAEELWEKGRQKLPPNRYFEMLCDAGRYQVICASGETPPTLQGIWTGTNHVPWSADYTRNGNEQTVILSNLPGNMFECMDSFIRYEESLIPEERENARVMYGYPGILSASRTSSHGLNNHFSVEWPMTFWTTGAAWNAHFFYDYYLYTMDREFFLNHALPYMKECIVFFEKFLIEDENGKWMFVPSYSPENKPANSPGISQACINATMDVALVSELLRNLIQGCETEGVEKESLPKWRAMLGKMPAYQINEDGALKEWCTSRHEDFYDHRHSSHLYPLYYGVAEEFKNQPELMEAAKKAYEMRMKYKKQEIGVMAFGTIQMAMTAVHLGDTDTAWRLLCSIAENNYYNTFSPSHNAGPFIFNCDISGGVPGLIFEMLIQSYPVTDENGKIQSFEIRLLPNLPEPWQSGSLRGVRARGGFELNFSWENGKVTQCEVISHSNYSYTMG